MTLTSVDFSCFTSVSSSENGDNNTTFSMGMLYIRCSENFKDDIRPGFCPQRFGNLPWRDQVPAARCKDQERCSSSDSEDPMGLGWGGVHHNQASIECPYLELRFISFFCATSPRPEFSEVLGHSLMSNSLQPHELQPFRLLCPFSRQEYWSGLPFPSPELSFIS